MKKKIVYIAPHLSTGGMPQYLVKQIESIKDDMDVYCIEWGDVTGGVLVVQRNKMVNLLGNKLITLKENKHVLFDILDKIKPDVVHLQEIPEYFMPADIADRLYDVNRKYVIIETSHDSGYNADNKTYLPDKFLMVSKFQTNEYQKLNIPMDVVEYPIENKIRTKTREQAVRDLGLDPNVKHVINVGLFTPRKNQAEVIEYARMLKNYPIQFHFLGNHADNFRFYWEPLMKEFPSNCKWWNERSDVDSFYEAADLFLFTSRGHATDMETMPLVIRESLSWKVPSLIYNLPVYMGYFDKYDTIEYLTEDLQKNAYRIAEKLFTNNPISTVDSFFNFDFDRDENKIIISYKRQENFYTKISIKDKDSNAPIYWFDTTFSAGMSYWVMPIPPHIFKFNEEPSFSTFLIEFYDADNKLQFSKEIYVKEATQKRTVKLDLKNSFDCLFNNYNEMFVEKRYDCYDLNNLDVVLDIGANNGLFSLLMLNNGCKKIYAFEPNQDSLVNLKHMFRNNDAVVSIEKAVYTEDKNLEFFIDPNNTTIGSVSEQHLLSEGITAQKIVVPAISLKTFIQEHNLDKISLVKIDIEGAEYEIIEHLEDEVYDKIDNFLIEYHDNTDGRIVKLINTLKSKGYDITQIRNQNSKNNELISDKYETSKIGTLLAKKTPKSKLLTVIIPCYNHEQYIEQCVESVLKQKTLFDFHIKISDDCSTDSTYNLIQKYKDVPNVTVHRTLKNEGPNPYRLSNLLKGIDSEYVTVLDGDDYYTDEYKLQKQFDFLENNPEYVIHSTGWMHTSEENVAYAKYNFDGSNGLEMCSLKDEVALTDNYGDINYVGFGFMFRNKYIKNTKFPDWFFDKDVFDGYWALINLLLEHGLAKNEDWIGGRYRITENGHFGEKDDNWKEAYIKRQAAVYKRVYQTSSKPILIVDAFFHDDYNLTVFRNYLASVKKLNIPIMLVTNSKFDTSLVDEVDYILYDSNNRLFKNEYKDVDIISLYWYNGKEYISTGVPAYQRHGLSVLSNLYHSTNLAKSLGYTHFYRIEYDSLLDDIDSIKNIVSVVESTNKKGLVYINQNTYVAFQLWYFELEYFTQNFPKINNESDYLIAKEKFNYHKDFANAEEFIYNMIKISHDGFSNVIVKSPEDMHKDYGKSRWNTVLSPTESEKMINGCVASVCRVVLPDDLLLAEQYKPRPDWVRTPEMCEVDFSKVALMTWNCSSDAENHSVIKVTYPDGNVNTFEHTIRGTGNNMVDIIDVVDGDINIEITVNNVSKKNFVINKTTIPMLSDVYMKQNSR